MPSDKLSKRITSVFWAESHRKKFGNSIAKGSLPSINSPTPFVHDASAIDPVTIQDLTPLSLQALALRNRKIYVHEIPILPHAPVDIYLDIEGLPDRNFHYLLGLVIHDEGKVSHHDFWADNKDEETMIFQQFLALLRQYPAFTLFHYGSYEAKYLQKMRPSLGDEAKQYLEKIIQK